MKNWLRNTVTGTGMTGFLLFGARSAWAHTEGARGASNWMNGWDHWGMGAGWMWIVPVGLTVLLVLGVAALVKALVPVASKSSERRE